MSWLLITLIAGLTGMLGWGIADFFAKKTIDKIGDLKTLIGSQFIGVAFLFVWYLLGNHTIPEISKSLIIYLIIFAFVDGLGYLMLYRAFEKGIVSIVSPIASSCAGVSVLVAVFLLKESLSTTGILGVILMFLGIIITSTDFTDLKKVFSKENLVNGVPEALVVMICWGFWFPLWDRFIENKDWLFWLIVLKIMIGFMLCIYFYATSKGKNLLKGYKSVLKILIPVAVLDTLAYFGTTWGYSASTNTTSLITVMSNAYSLPTIILAYLFLKERITKQQALGIASIIGGIVVSSI